MDALTIPFDTILFQLSERPVTLGETLIAAGIAVMILLLLLILFMIRNARRRLEKETLAAERAREAEERLAEMVATQQELTGRMQSMSETMVSQQSALQRQVNERLDGMTGRIGQSITDTTKSTQESLAKLQERLAVIDTAQTNITALTGQVVELQSILSNKQTRGAFGQGRMEAIIADGLPNGGYDFQTTLSNGNRPDCTVVMPNKAPRLVIDAKFPLEAWNAIRATDNPDERKRAAAQFRRDMGEHLKAISEKYLLPGETQDTAFMFVPSESIFADIHEFFEDIVQRAHKARVVIVSPSLLMLSIQVIQAVLKDARMREQAHLIQGEVGRLMEDVNRLDDRVRKLSTHFGQAQKNVDLVLTSNDKINKRGTRIIDLDFAPREAASSPPIPPTPQKPDASVVKTETPPLRAIGGKQAK